jgi:hypothetical protein
MPVYREREGRRAVPEPAADHQAVEAGGDQRRCVRVPQRMEHNRGKLQRDDCPPPVATEIVGRARGAVRHREHQVVPAESSHPQRQAEPNLAQPRDRSASTAEPGRLTARRPCHDFGAFTRSPAFVSSMLRSTRTIGASRSTSPHRSAQSSPRRMPVPRATATIKCKGWPPSWASTEAICEPVRVWISWASTLGGRSTLATFRPTSSSRVARRRLGCQACGPIVE